MRAYLQYRQFRRRAQDQVRPSPRSLEDRGRTVSIDTAQRSVADSPSEEKRTDEAGDETLEKQKDTPRSQLNSESTERSSPQNRETKEGKDDQTIIVGWDGEDDPTNPKNFPESKKLLAILNTTMISFVVTMASSIDATIIPQASEEFGVSQVTESLGGTGIYLIGFGTGCLYAGPLSEVLGRNASYLGCLFIFMIWIMASALSPNIGAQLAFRFLAGLFGSPALTVAGGTVADLYDALGKTYAFPIYAITGFGGPILSEVIAAYIGPSSVISWRWTEWVTLIAAGLVFTIVFMTQPETYAPLLLTWKAKHLRAVTADQRYRSPMEMDSTTLHQRLLTAMTRPFILVKSELIVIAMTVYLSVLYIVTFTFFDGYPYIFQETYGISQGLTFTLFTAMFIGVLTAFIPLPFIYRASKKNLEKRQQEGKTGIRAEIRLWYAMMGAPIMPISLLWMAWTCYPSISIWSPILASVLYGFAVVSIFISAYMYIIDSYEVYSASALTFVALVRYYCAGGMTVVGLPFYGNLGPHWTLTILGAIGAVMAVVPFGLYFYGSEVRKRSKFAVNKNS